MVVDLVNQEEYKFMKSYSHKMCRRFGVKLCQSAKCPSTRRNYPPGIHGPKGKPRLTEYGMQLAEKQKAKIIYNVSEKQFHLTFDKASKVTGDIGKNLLTLLEMRLDNVVYRLGLAATRSAARQVVNHAHVLVNGKKVNIPSYIVKSGDVVSLHSGSMDNKYFKNIVSSINKENIPGWLNLDEKKIEGKVLHAPAKEDAEKIVDTQAIVEFYSRR